MGRPTKKPAGWLRIVGILFAAAIVYGLVIEPLTGNNAVKETASRIVESVAKEAPTDAPTAAPAIAPTEAPPLPTYVPTNTPAPTSSPTPTRVPTDTPAPTKPPTLKQGSKGQEVRKIQTELIRLGYLSGTADGDYGKKTAQAVKDFQVCNGLKEDGVFGQSCWDCMFSGYYVRPQTTVYVSKQGKYHTDEHCSGMTTSTKMNLSDAIRKGYDGHKCH